jgi:hypothetical protein
MQRVVVIGLGELGTTFAQGLLRQGHAVFPALRSTVLAELESQVPDPAFVLLTVGEHDLPGALNELPHAWRDRAVLVQNELLPRTWLEHGLRSPTVAVVWFEKKPGHLPRVLLPTVLHGRHATLIGPCLHSLGIPYVIAADDSALLFELVRKNLYILVTNISGIRTQGSVADLWNAHRPLARAVAAEILDLQQALTGADLPRDRLMTALIEAFEADPDHRCMGRTAPERLKRALQHADHYGVTVPTLRSIATETGAQP